jgi:hypothetical protein
MGALAGLLLAGTGIASPAEGQPGVVRFTAVGEVIAVEDRSQTVVIRSELQGKEWIVGARVTPQTTIERRGSPARFPDVTVGAQVRVQYERRPDEEAGRALVLTILPDGASRSR